MSTILDALKKSEEERKVTKVPTLADMQAPQEPSKWPNVLLIIIVGLLLVLLALAVRFILHPPVKPVEPTPNVVEESIPQIKSDQQNVVSQETQVLAADSSVGESDDAIEVNVVSYSEQPEKRFVMIGGKLYRENEFVRTGLKIEEIRQNEVVLNNRGEQIIRRP